jgi:hypothetical protein
MSLEIRLMCPISPDTGSRYEERCVAALSEAVNCSLNQLKKAGGMKRARARAIVKHARSRVLKMQQRRAKHARASERARLERARPHCKVCPSIDIHPCVECGADCCGACFRRDELCDCSDGTALRAHISCASHLMLCVCGARCLQSCMVLANDQWICKQCDTK